MLEQLIEDWLTNRTPNTERALIEFLQTHAQNVLRYQRVPDHVIDDLRQECVVRMLALLEQGYSHRGSETGLLRRVCTNRAIDYFREQTRENQRFVAPPVSDESHTNEDLLSKTADDAEPKDPESLYQQEQTTQQVRDALRRHLSQLSPSQRYVIYAIYIEDRSNEEITQQRFARQLEEDGLELQQLSKEERHARWTRARAWFDQNHRRGMAILRILFSRDEEFSRDAE